MEDLPALRLHRIRKRAEAAIRRGEKLDPRTIHDIATGRKA